MTIYHTHSLGSPGGLSGRSTYFSGLFRFSHVETQAMLERMDQALVYTSLIKLEFCLEPTRFSIF